MSKHFALHFHPLYHDSDPIKHQEMKEGIYTPGKAMGMNYYAIDRQSLSANPPGLKSAPHQRESGKYLPYHHDA